MKQVNIFNAWDRYLKTEENKQRNKQAKPQTEKQNQPTNQKQCLIYVLCHFPSFWGFTWYFFVMSLLCHKMS